jgi:hypothetical protein
MGTLQFYHDGLQQEQSLPEQTFWPTPELPGVQVSALRTQQKK